MGTPRGQESRQTVSAAPAMLLSADSSSPAQSGADSNDHMGKLLSLPSFGKVVYRTHSASIAQKAAPKHWGLGSSLPKAAALTDSQQMLLQGHASIGSRPPSLEFDSQFESGNLQKAVQASHVHRSMLLVPQ